VCKVREILLAKGLEKSQYHVGQASGLPIVHEGRAAFALFHRQEFVERQDDYLERTVKKARASIDQGGGDD
jgi:hypothetical protein